MIWSRTILDGIVVCLIFNVTIALLWMMVPMPFQKCCRRKYERHLRKEKRKK